LCRSYRVNTYLLCACSVFLLTAVACKYGNDTGQLRATPLFDSIMDKAAIYYDEGDTMKAFHYLDSTYPLYKKANIVDKFRRYNFYADLYSNKLKDYYNAMSYADSLLDIVNNADNAGRMKTEHAHANYVKGDILFDIGDYEKAYDYYYKAKTISIENGDTCIMAYYSYRLGMVLYKQQQYKIAISYFGQALQEGHACATAFVFFYRNQELMDNIALCYSQLGMPDSAITYYQEALSYVEQNCPTYEPKRAVECEKAVGVIYGNLGSAYFAKKEYTLAEKWFKMSISINSRKGNVLLDAQYTSLKLANMYMIQDKYGDAYPLLKQVRTVLDHLYDKEAEMRWNNLMWKYYEHLGQPAPALAHLSRYMSFKDSIAGNIESLRGIDVDQRVNNRDKEYQISLLKKQNEIKEAYLTLAVLTAFLSIVIILLIYQNSIRSRKNVDLLTQLNKRIQEQKIELEASNKEKDRILKAVAHDVRSPVNSILALAELMRSTPDGLSEEQKEFLLLMEEACNNALDLSKDIMDASASLRPENLKKEQVSINMLLGNTIELIRPKALEKNQKIVFRFTDENLQLFIDKGKIARVIANLLTNAIKFSPPGADIKVKFERKENSVHISIEDKGIGIPEELKEKVFDMFTEAKRSGTFGEKPYGLGLSITKHIVETHGGNIWFVSEPGKGATFCFSLPIDNK